MTPALFNTRRVLAAVVAGLVVTSFLPARREAPLTRAPRHALALLLTPVSQTVRTVSMNLLGSGGQERETLTEAQEDRDNWRKLFYRAQAELDEARQQIIALSHLRQLLPEAAPPVAFIHALVAGSSVGRGYARLEINRGTTSGVGRGMIVVSSEYLVGRVSDAGPATATVSLITYPPDTVLAAYLVPPRSAEALARKVAVNLSVGPDGRTFVTSDDIRDGVAVGDVAYLVDTSWPPKARGFIIGRVERIDKDAENPLLMHRIIVRPQVSGLTRLIVVAPLPDAEPAAPHKAR